MHLQAGTAAGFAEAAPSFLAGLGVFLLSVLFQIPFMRRLVPAVTFDGTPFGFRGSVGTYFGINLLARDTRPLLCEFAELAAPLRVSGPVRFGVRP